MYKHLRGPPIDTLVFDVFPIFTAVSKSGRGVYRDMGEYGIIEMGGSGCARLVIVT